MAPPGPAERPARTAPTVTPTTGGGGWFPGARRVIDCHGGGYRWFSGWFWCLGAAWAHLGILNVLNTAIATTHLAVAAPLALGALAAPAAVTAWAVPAARGGAWRWLAVYSLLAFTFGQGTAVVIPVGETVLLHRFWVSQRTFGHQWTPPPGFEPTPDPKTVTAWLTRGRR